MCSVLLVAACGQAGSGNVSTDVRAVGDFDRLDISGGVNVDLVVDSSAEIRVAVVYDDNLQDNVVTRLDGDTLVIETQGNINVTGRDRRVEVTVPELVEMKVDSGSNVDGSGALSALTLGVTGGANVDLGDLEVANMDIDVDSGANVGVNVSDTITGQASGGANLTIGGDPTTRNVDVSGGANVHG
jgi:Putative auto-transporter adhesin, head GIN domain